MTVAELRKALDELDDNAELFIENVDYGNLDISFIGIQPNGKFAIVPFGFEIFHYEEPKKRRDSWRGDVRCTV